MPSAADLIAASCALRILKCNRQTNSGKVANFMKAGRLRALNLFQIAQLRRGTMWCRFGEHHARSSETVRLPENFGRDLGSCGVFEDYRDIPAPQVVGRTWRAALKLWGGTGTAESIFGPRQRGFLREKSRKSMRNLVDLDGFEPSTSSMPWKRAPNCATGPL